ncbi:MAG TPA: 16S rRNA (uracil(1498)-N(3))-methyltransferase [Erysipelotrichaceae bacterium]|nr:16S rRNA (uracil(1498)-N(3))-methyltransferase [Erysipelotrichaceae bacterium]
MQRYFAKVNEQKYIQLSADDKHHIVNVMRMKKGDEIEVVDNQKLFLCRLENISPLIVHVVRELKSDVEIKEDITLLFALTKGDKIDLVMQKATELGVKRIALIESERTIVRYEDKKEEKKLERFKKIMKEASEQSHRLLVPELLGVFPIKNLPPAVFSDLNYVAYEKDAQNVNLMFEGIKKGKSISILIGPEGGFSENEIDYLTERGFIRTSLGKRILRAETAAIYALSVIGYLLEK